MAFKAYSKYSQIIKFDELQTPDAQWKLLESIGEGTYGEVFKVQNLNTSQLAAVKIIGSVHEVIEEIEEEYQVLKDSNHQNLPKFFGIYMKKSKDEDQLWLVMELCSNGSVTDLVKLLQKDNKKIDELMIAHILKETLLAIQYLHKSHVMHRDVKGHNILITENGSIKLVDFGVSAHLKGPNGKRNTSVGTPFWMAPEVIACEQQIEYEYDVRCDIWSLGITAIELADGEPPLSAMHPMRALFKIPRNPPPTFQTPSDWSANYNDFVKKCLIKDFEKRPTADELLKHPFIAQVPKRNESLKDALKALFKSPKKNVEKLPETTTRHAVFKSKRESKIYDSSLVNDLATLESFDEESIVSQLYNRYMQSHIYTYIGDILLAINPFSKLPIYSSEISKRYQNSSKSDNAPHIYAIADFTYQSMMYTQTNQCVIISGESGSGKTESANFLLQQLTILGRAPTKCIEEKILQVNPLMEAFGNAKTVINDNSSRFGKYLEILFTKSGRVVGAQLNEYLLEKSRVVHQSSNEQNFHIFYYVYDGLSNDANRIKYHLKHDVKYKYLSDIESSQRAMNKTKFNTIHNCFEIIGFKSQEINSIYSILAGVLHLGNLDFMQDEGIHNDGKCQILNRSLLVIISQLLGVDEKEFQDALTQSTIVTRGETLIKSNSLQECTAARDSMSKGLYGRLFSWIVNKINVLLQSPVYESRNAISISLLDIFGFENFSHNSFEQLCINITNEQLQYYFNQHVFAWEMQEYLNEGIQAYEIEFVDNRSVIDMCLAKPMGLLALLDEESHFPKANDSTLVEKFHHNIKSNCYSKPKTNELIFTIKHYAGPVQYDANGFLAKNCDYLPPEIMSLLRQSEISLIRSLFSNPLTKTGNLAYGTMSSTKDSNVKYIRPGNSKSNPSQNKVQATVATYFRYSLMELLSKMVTGVPHFVRCIRPNRDKTPGFFDKETVSMQLRYTGVLETTKIRRLGYSHRIVFNEFVKRYSILLWPSRTNIPQTKETCVEMLEKLGFKNWKIGKTKVFLKYYHAEQLTRLYQYLNNKIVLVQSLIRCWLAKRTYMKTKEDYQKSAHLIQKTFRDYLVRKRKHRTPKPFIKSVIYLQAHIRGYLARKKVRALDKKNCAILANNRHSLSRLNRAAVVIQAYWRSYKARKAFKSTLREKSIEKLQLAHFCQQVALLNDEVYMWMIKSDYQIDKKQLRNINLKLHEVNETNLSSIDRRLKASKSKLQQKKQLKNDTQNYFYLNEEMTNKIKKTIENKVSVFNNSNNKKSANENCFLSKMKPGIIAHNGLRNSNHNLNFKKSNNFSSSSNGSTLVSGVSANTEMHKEISYNYNRFSNHSNKSDFVKNAQSKLVNSIFPHSDTNSLRSSVVNLKRKLTTEEKSNYHSCESKHSTNSSESDFYSTSTVFNFRALLRKTGQDLASGQTLSKKRLSSDTNQIDFRNVLKNRTNKQTQEE